MPKHFYKITYGRYGKYRIVAYFRDEGDIIVKVDTFHNKISRVKRSAIDLTHKRDTKEIVTEDEFIDAMNQITESPLSFNRNVGKKRNMELMKKEKLPLEKRIKYIILCIIFFPALLMILSAMAKSAHESRQNKKYKKVIKKGLFWDTEYLIERE